MDIQIMQKKQLITWVSKNTWEMFHSEFSQEQFIDTCSMKIICYYCDQNIVSGDIFHDVENVDKQEHFRF